VHERTKKEHIHVKKVLPFKGKIALGPYWPNAMHSCTSEINCVLIFLENSNLLRDKMGLCLEVEAVGLLLLWQYVITGQSVGRKTDA
jgi:hypothetical protein